MSSHDDDRRHDRLDERIRTRELTVEAAREQRMRLEQFQRRLRAANQARRDKSKA